MYQDKRLGAPLTQAFVYLNPPPESIQSRPFRVRISMPWRRHEACGYRHIHRRVDAPSCCAGDLSL